MPHTSQFLNAPNSIEASYLLSPLQQGMLFHYLQSPSSGVDIEQVCGTLRESINYFAFEQAWQRVIAHHPALRTAFAWVGLSEPQQQVYGQVHLPITSMDWSDQPRETQESQFAAYLVADRQQGFDLAQAPLMRLAVLCFGPADYRMIWTFHHILLDGRSLRVVLRQVFSVYEALCQGQPIALELARPYQDYIDWQQQQDWSEAKSYWQTLLSDFDQPTPLPAALENESSFHRRAEKVLCLSVELTTELRSLAARHLITPNTIVQGAWALLLSYYSGQDDVVFGATRACRHSTVAGAESMVGLLINTLPVRLQVAGTEELIPWLQALRQQHLAVRPYEHTPLVEVQRWSGVPAGTPLFESIVAFENYRLTDELQTQGGRWLQREFQLLEQPSYPLVLLGHLATELQLTLLYDPHRFDSDLITRMMGHLHTLIEGMVTHPERRLAELPILTAAECHQILVEWNSTDVDYPRHWRLHDLFETQVQHNPEAIAVCCAGQTLTYGELNRRANQLAHYLQHRGVAPEVTVGVCIERSLEMVIALLAILKAGGAYVPLDPTYPQERLSHILSDAQPLLVLTQSRFLDLLALSAIPILCLDADFQSFANAPKTNPICPATATNLAYIIYTSGSTGKPKGVLIEHRGAVNTLLDINRRFQVGSQDRVLAICSLNFDLSVYDIFGLLAAGGTVVLPKPAIAPDLKDWLTLLEQEQITLWNTPPLVLQALTTDLASRQATLPTSLRLVLLSGDWIPLTLPEQIHQLAVGSTPIQVISLGGATEASIWSIVYPIGAINPDWKSIPYGRPMANQQFYILDRCHRPVPVGQIGELYIGGDGVARGYHRRPELNQEKFLPDRFRSGTPARLYRTGDLGRFLADGTIEFLGRVDHQVKVRGFRVELGEIEAVLAAHPAIQDAVVVAQPDSVGGQRLIAYLVPRPEIAQKEPEAELIQSIRTYLTGKLPDYMVPSGFVRLASLPLTANGKLDRKALPPIQLSSLKDTVTGLTSEMPLTPVQQQLIEIWQEVLGVKPIAITDNFFELGGHSLIAMRLWAKIGQVFAEVPPLITLFQAPTVEQLAVRLQQPLSRDRFCPSLVIIQPGQPDLRPPLFYIHTLGRGLRFCRPFVQHMDARQPVYGLSTQIANENYGSNRVEDLATHYLWQIQTIQPEGPYLLAGASFGGTVAFEMARQLVAQGQQVGLLALLDTRLPKAMQPRSVTAKLSAHKQNLSQQGTRYLRKKLQDGVQGYFQSLRHQSRQFYLGLATHLYQWLNYPLPDRLQDYLFELENHRSGERYRPNFYEGTAVLFRAEDDPSSNRAATSQDLGWQQLVGQLRIHSIPGSHLSMLSEPNVQILGRQLQHCIDWAIAGPMIPPTGSECDPTISHEQPQLTEPRWNKTS